METETPARPYSPLGEIIAAKDLPLIILLSKTTAWRLMRKGKFPQPIQLSPGRIGWRRSDLEQWLKERADAGRPTRRGSRATDEDIERERDDEAPESDNLDAPTAR